MKMVRACSLKSCIILVHLAVNMTHHISNTHLTSLLQVTQNTFDGSPVTTFTKGHLLDQSVMGPQPWISLKEEQQLHAS